MLNVSRLSTAMVALTLISTVTLRAKAQEKGTIKGPVIKFALAHPANDQSLGRSALGDSVPQNIKLSMVGSYPNFAYYYSHGTPVVVDVPTRSVVWIGSDHLASASAATAKDVRR